MMEPDQRLYRSESNRMIAGVAGGLGAYFDTDPTIFRLGFVALAFVGGSGIVAYLVAWIIVPPDSRPDTPPESVPRENLDEALAPDAEPPDEAPARD